MSGDQDLNQRPTAFANHVEIWGFSDGNSAANIDGFARALAQEYEIGSAHVAALRELLRGVRLVYSQRFAKGRFDYDLVEKVGVTAAAVLDAWNGLDNGEKHTITRVLQCGAKVQLPKHFPTGADADQTVLIKDPLLHSDVKTRGASRTSLDVILQGLSQAVQHCCERRPGPGAPAKTPIVIATDLIRNFWCSLGRDFARNFGPGIDANNDPLENFYPLNDASRFCSAVLRSVGAPDVEGRSIDYAMKKVGQKRKGKSQKRKGKSKVNG